MVKSWSYPQEFSALSTEKSVSLLSSAIGDRSSEYWFCEVWFCGAGFCGVGFFGSWVPAGWLGGDWSWEDDWFCEDDWSGED
jgi:hypothetical protein